MKGRLCMSQYDLKTKLVHDGQFLVSGAKEVNEPVFLTATYHQNSFSDMSGYGYARGKNPTREALEHLIASLEGGNYGFAFASGMAAINAALSVLKSGDKVLVIGNIYGGTYGLLNNTLTKYGISSESLTENDPEQIEKHITKEVRLIYFESPTNPTLSINDIRGIAGLAKAHGLLTIIDNTFMSPYLQRPLELGVDIVVESSTKYLGGHSDILGGVIAVKDEALAEQIHMTQVTGGGIMAPFDAYLLIRSIKTLGVRLERQTDNAEKLASYLAGHPAISHVNYPGLPKHPGYELHRSQAKRSGAMISFDLKPEYDIETFFDSLGLIIMGGSLGGVESLISHPLSTSHRRLPEELREKLGITYRMARLSVGIEAAEDLIADLEQALQKAAR